MSDDVKDTRKRLLAKAREAKKNSYSPYSNFPVGAAVLLDDGQIFIGTNIENASYGLTCCAERVALFSARTANNSAKVTEIAISIGPDDTDMDPKSLSPCGACRQVMAEFMDTAAPVHIDRRDSFTMGELLPHNFVLK